MMKRDELGFGGWDGGHRGRKQGDLGHGLDEAACQTDEKSADATTQIAAPQDAAPSSARPAAQRAGAGTEPSLLVAGGPQATALAAASGKPVASPSSVSVSEDGSLSGQQAVAVDPNNDPLTFKLVGPAPAGLTFNPNGTWGYTPPEGFQTLNAGQSATVTFKFSASDGQNTSNPALVMIKILGADDRPVASNASAAVYKNASITGEQFKATDPNGDPLTFKLVGNAPAGLTINNDGTWSYTPPPTLRALQPGKFATVVFSYTASDGKFTSLPAKVTIKVHASNATPLANYSSASVSEDGTLSNWKVTGSDADGDRVKFSLVGDAPDGVTFNADGTWSFAPPPMFQKLDTGESQIASFQFRANDGFANSAPATVTITVQGANDAPVAVDGAASVSEDDALTGQAVVANDIDEEPLIYSLVGLAPEGLNFNSDGTWSYTPPASYQSLNDNEAATVSFQFRANDGTANSNASTVIITIEGSDDGIPPLAPTIASFVDDTGVLGDRLTSDRNPLFRGTAEAGVGVELFVGGTSIGTTNADGDGNWTFDYAGTPIADGIYDLTAIASRGGLKSEVSQVFGFEVDGAAPETPSFDLSKSSDTGTAGDQETSAAQVTLVGQSEANAKIDLVGTDLTTIVNKDGAFFLNGVSLGQGANPLLVRATDAAGNTSTFELDIARVAATGAGNVVLSWIQATLDAIKLDASTPIFASRALAIESVAVLDVVNAIDGLPTFMVKLPVPGDVSAEAAVAATAHAVLSHLYPAQGAIFDALLASSLAAIPDGAAKTAGFAYGEAMATAIIAIRDSDGWDAFVTEPSSTAPGAWQPTAPLFSVPLEPQWGDVAPFALESGDQFRPGAPPALDSAEYTDAFNEVKALGAAFGSTRTADQTEIARFWADGPGTFTPAGHWNQIALVFAASGDASITDNARLFAMLNVALADAGIAAWDTKYAYDYWRPITAINNADADGNPLTDIDPSWRSLLITPPFPEYVSGHSTYSAAAATVLQQFYGDADFATTSEGLPGVTRSFGSVADAAAEAGLSRIYGGIHYGFSNETGQALGQDIGQYVLGSFNGAADTRAPRIIIENAKSFVSATNFDIRGFALDNLSGLEQLQAKLDGGGFVDVAVGADGRFSLPSGLALDGTADGKHTLTFIATDAAGNQGAPIAYHFTLDTQAPTLTLDGLADGSAIDADTLLKGIADGTNSSIVALAYQFDAGKPVPITFDQATGAFNQLLDLSLVGTGSHQLKILATDGAGFATEQTLDVSLDAPIPFAIKQITPTNGASDIGVTFRPQVTFTRPIDPATLNAATFFATDTSGAVIPANVVVSQDGLRAWLFVDDAMPGASNIRLHLDGAAIQSVGDNVALDGDGDGLAGGDFLSNFVTVSTAPVPNTTIVGRVLDPGVDLKPMTFDDVRAGPDQTLHTADDVFLNLLQHVKVFILGRENEAVYTDAQGAFTLTIVPTGDVKVVIDGRTATNAPAGIFFPEMVMDSTIRPGIANTLMGSMGSLDVQDANATYEAVYLPRLETDILLTVSDNEPTNITAVPGSTGGTSIPLTDEQRRQILLVIQPGSLIDADGRPLTDAQVGVSVVPPELVKDMLPPGLLQHTFDITIQAPGAAGFTTSAQLTLPNVLGLAPGEKTFFLSFDHTTGRLVIDGTATVSEDGLTVTTDPGQGITQPGWHGMTPPGSQDDRDITDPPPLDTDRDHITDKKDSNDDGDSYPDSEDPDGNGNGIPDDEELDTDGDRIPDKYDPDDDNDDIPDWGDADANGNGIPDDEELDSDGDGIPDVSDWDDDNDGIRDDGDEDADGNGIPDGNGDNQPNDVMFQVGIGLNGKWTPFSLSAEFTFDVPIPRTLLIQPIDYKLEFRVPSSPLIFAPEFKLPPILVDSFWAKVLDRGFDFKLFTLTGEAGLLGFAKLTAAYSQTGQKLPPNNAELDGEVGIGVSLFVSEKLTKPAWLAAIPFGIGNFLTDEHAYEYLLQGFSIEIKQPLTAHQVSPIDFTYSVGPEATLKAETIVEDLSVHVSLRRLGPVVDSSLLLSRALIGQTVELPPISTSPGIGADTRVYYRYFLEDGTELSGASDKIGRIREFLPANADFDLFLYKPSSNVTLRRGPRVMRDVRAWRLVCVTIVLRGRQGWRRAIRHQRR